MHGKEAEGHPSGINTGQLPSINTSQLPSCIDLSQVNAGRIVPHVVLNGQGTSISRREDGLEHFPHLSMRLEYHVSI